MSIPRIFLVYIGLCLLLISMSSVMDTQLFCANYAANENILLVTAHPDDETMFFGPTLIWLTKCSPKNVHIICLSSGDFFGQGFIRKEELVSAMDRLSIPPGNVVVVDDKRLKDGLNETWDPQLIAQTVASYAKSIKASKIISFDEHGISSHPNHVAIFNGLLIMRKLVNIPLISLESQCIFRKYISFLDILWSLLEKQYFHPRAIIISISPLEYYKLLRALVQHRSQMVWFRWLYAAFSRYMLVNSLAEVTVS